MIGKEKIGVGSLLSLLGLNLVSAASPSYYMESFIEWMNSNYAPIFAALFGVNEFDEFLFAKILLFILLFSVIFMSLKKSKMFSGNRPVLVIVTLIVSIFAVRFMKENEFINGILLPYGALGTAITILLPLVIYFMFVHTSVPGSFGRRAAWVFYGLIFLIFWGMRSAEIATEVDYIYIGGLILVIIFLLFDSSVHKYFGNINIFRNTQPYRDKLKREILRDIQDLDADLRSGIIDNEDYRRQKAFLRQRYNQLDY